ncbi:MAG: hypothetical protein J6V26_03995 [Alistipes sp.]|nr:hypothetical protein [Alistipes sp.]
MRIRNSITKFVAVALVGILSMGTAHAQYTYKFKDELGTYKVTFTPADNNTKFEGSYTKPLHPRTHELRLSSTWGGTDAYGFRAEGSLMYIGSDTDYPQNVLWGPQHWLGATLEYGYWINEWFSVGCSVTWTAGIRNIYNNKTKQLWLTLRRDYISFVPTARFAWYRNGVFQLYSSLGLGAGIQRRVRYIDGKENLIDAYFAYDLKPIGLAIGHKWFGYVEVGYGSRGIVNVGFGYRINTKTK